MPDLGAALLDMRSTLEETRLAILGRPTSLSPAEDPVLHRLARLEAMIDGLGRDAGFPNPPRTEEVIRAIEQLRNAIEEAAGSARRRDRSATDSRLGRALDAAVALNEALRHAEALGERRPSSEICKGGCGLRSGPEERLAGEAVAVGDAVYCFPCLLEAKEDFETLDSYALLGPLGRGGQGVVRLALDRPGRRLVAIKFLRSRVSRDPAARLRLGREIVISEALEHPNIVRFLDHGRAPGGQDYLVMEYAPGQTLRQLLREVGRLRPDRAAGIAVQVARALEYASLHDVVHRDLKPENIRIDREGRVRVLDLGLAKWMSTAGYSTITDCGVTIGTAGYAAPEQLEDPCRADHRADIFSLGVILYEMVSGVRPFGRESGDHSDLPNLVPGIDPAFVRIVHRALARQASDRQGAPELVRELEPFVRGISS